MGDLDLGMDKKKKKSKKPKDDGEDGGDSKTGGGSSGDMGPNDIYPYAEILQRVYDSLSEKNPELLGAKKFTMIPPQVAREGSKKTVFVNFKDMCKKCTALWNMSCHTSMLSWVCRARLTLRASSPSRAASRPSRLS